MTIYDCSTCGQKCHSRSGLSRHKNNKHPQFPTPIESAQHKCIYHPFLDARPCDIDGKFLNTPASQIPPVEPETSMSENPFEPFQDCLAFDWAYYHYVRLQSSKSDILEGLDLWHATVIKHDSSHLTGDEVLWRNADSLYQTIDAIQVGDTPWKCYKFSYTGPKPPTPPHWMEETYELNTRDALLILEQQLATSDFSPHITYVPYQEFDASGNRIVSDLMSGDWPFRQADIISRDHANHGAMFVPIVAGSDKTTVSVATGHQEYHPVYISPGDISNTAHRGHGNGVLPVAFLPIPKTSKWQRKRPEFQRFCHQLYHQCLALVFEPLKPYMETYKVVKCPDGHFRCAIFGLGPYIADYPEQVWLGGIVSNWCPKCDAMPDDLDKPGSHHRSHEKTDLLIKTFDPGILWDEFGIRNDIVPFTHGFLHADIHELLSPDLLHQLIKGTFKDHLVTWVNDYLYYVHGEKVALEIIEDIDHRISAVPPYPGLRRFPDGRDYNQWTGDDSKALMKVYLVAIAGYLPSAMVQCIATFMDACYIARRNAITSPALEHFRTCVEKFHALCNIFIEARVRATISLPHQHALHHYFHSIKLFGLPNGLCSSITESKHIKAVKEPWRRSSQYHALSQMLQTLVRMDKMAALRQELAKRGLLAGTTSSFIERMKVNEGQGEGDKDELCKPRENDADDDDDDIGPAEGNPLGTLSDVKLASKCEPGYPHNLHQLADFICQRSFPLCLCRFLFIQNHPDKEVPDNMDALPVFEGEIKVYHSALTIYYALSDLCGAGGLQREHIRSMPSFFGHERRDTIFVVLDESKKGMEGMEIGRVLLFFSFHYRRKTFSCALINWFIHDDECDSDTGMWMVQLEHDGRGRPTVEVIDIDAIARGAHLLPIYGSS
ncbi:hypothetical protein CPB84DRAFT_1845636 [Gymnopilus junonius]|uniref:C2H2-type domain-containing protein n=1 Tax=Gymnopilus junonius TaxID=109634 RepID=A0A9P5NT58_GYMJU|nr:hypothetical protein CPB84DRAFT_1845636 [Gymnopilus junonius]